MLVLVLASVWGWGLVLALGVLSALASGVASGLALEVASGLALALGVALDLSGAASNPNQPAPLYHTY